MIYVRDVDKLIETLTKSLPMDLEPFFKYFQTNYSLEKTAFTITLAQFTQIYIEYIETTHREKHDGNQERKAFNRLSDSMTGEAMNKFIFGENFFYAEVFYRVRR